jgi:membrane-associated phospholipid phosphatase
MTMVTDLGDLAVLLPIAVAIAVWLVVQRGWRDALAWAAALALCIGGTALLKIFRYACPLLSAAHNPSGHTSLSALVYGTLAVILAAAMPGRRRVAVFLAAAALICAIAASRVALGAHSAADTAAGMILGFASLAVFAAHYLRQGHALPATRTLAIVVALIVALLHGQDLRAEQMLQAIGVYLHRSDAAACE